MAADAAPQMLRDQVFQLLSTAVYSAAEDPQRQHSLQQLSGITTRLQEPPGPSNDVAVFSNRCIKASLAKTPTAYGEDNTTCTIATHKQIVCTTVTVSQGLLHCYVGLS